MSHDPRRSHAGSVTPVRAVPPVKPAARGFAPYTESPSTRPQRPRVLRRVSAPPPLPTVDEEPTAPVPFEPPRAAPSRDKLPPPPARPRPAAPRAAAPTSRPDRGPRHELLPPPPPAPRAPRPRAEAAEERGGALVIDPERDDLALELLARADRMKPAGVPRRLPALSPRAAAELLTRGARAEEDGDHELAFRLYGEAQSAPACAGAARLAYGRLERALGQRQRAISTFKEALHHTTADPGLTACLYAELGELYWAMGEDDEADYYRRRAVGLDPSHAPLLRSRPRPPSDVHELNTRDLDLALIG